MTTCSTCRSSLCCTGFMVDHVGHIRKGWRWRTQIYRMVCWFHSATAWFIKLIIHPFKRLHKRIWSISQSLTLRSPAFKHPLSATTVCQTTTCNLIVCVFSTLQVYRDMGNNLLLFSVQASCSTVKHKITRKGDKWDKDQRKWLQVAPNHETNKAQNRINCCMWKPPY